MNKKSLAAILLSFATLAAASDISWKTFDIKTGPMLAAWDETGASTIGWSLSLVKPLTPYIGVGAMVEAGVNSSGCEDCIDYNFNELSEGLLLNLNIPLTRSMSLTSNFMVLVNFQDGEVHGLYYADLPIEAYDADGNSIWVYEMKADNDDYYSESFMFRSNLGLAWKINRFGLEFHPLDFAIVNGDSRMTFSLNATARVF